MSLKTDQLNAIEKEEEKKSTEVTSCIIITTFQALASCQFKFVSANQKKKKQQQTSYYQPTRCSKLQ